MRPHHGRCGLGVTRRALCRDDLADVVAVELACGRHLVGVGIGKRRALHEGASSAAGIVSQSSTSRIEVKNFSAAVAGDMRSPAEPQGAVCCKIPTAWRSTPRPSLAAATESGTLRVGQVEQVGFLHGRGQRGDDSLLGNVHRQHRRR